VSQREREDGWWGRDGRDVEEGRSFFIVLFIGIIFLVGYTP